MAFKDGMLAIVKVLRVAATFSAAACLAYGSYSHDFLIGALIAGVLFLMFWTPAWIINKFVQ